MHALTPATPRARVWQSQETTGCGLAFTRYSFTSKLLCTNQPLSFHPPTCIAYPGAILLHDYWTVHDSPSAIP